MDEQRLIKDFRRYKISADGVVWDTKTSRPISVYVETSNQKRFVYLHRSSKQYRRYIGRLVLQAFSPIADDKGFFAEWIDGDRSNNTLSNLRWKRRTPSNHYLTEEKVRHIHECWFASPNTTLKSIAESHGTSRSNIQQIISGRSWAWVKIQTPPVQMKKDVRPSAPAPEEQVLGVSISVIVKQARNTFVG